MTDVEYDSAAMREAMNKLNTVYHRLEKRVPDLYIFKDVPQPGGSRHTSAFHHQLMISNTAFIKNHYSRMKEVGEALNTLVAIDKEYNNGELVNQLNISKVTIPDVD